METIPDDRSHLGRPNRPCLPPTPVDRVLHKRFRYQDDAVPSRATRGYLLTSAPLGTLHPYPDPTEGATTPS